MLDIVRAGGAFSFDGGTSMSAIPTSSVSPGSLAGTETFPSVPSSSWSSNESS